MASYIVNREKTYEPGLEHEAHHVIHNISIGCPIMPAKTKWIELGEHSSCFEALAKAKALYPDADGCVNCCPACFTP